MLFEHQILQAPITFVDNHSHKVSEFFEMFWYVFLRGCTEPGCRKTTLYFIVTCQTVIVGDATGTPGPTTHIVSEIEY